MALGKTTQPPCYGERFISMSMPTVPSHRTALIWQWNNGHKYSPTLLHQGKSLAMVNIIKCKVRQVIVIHYFMMFFLRENVLNRHIAVVGHVVSCASLWEGMFMELLCCILIISPLSQSVHLFTSLHLWEAVERVPSSWEKERLLGRTLCRKCSMLEMNFEQICS